jgi:methyl-accepting chemotaxis protein
VELRKQLLARLKAGESVQSELQQQLLPAAAQYVAAMETLGDFQEDLNGQFVAGVKTAVSDSTLWLSLVALAGVVVGAVAAFVVTRSVTVPLAAAVDSARRIAAGDLGQPLSVDRGDELGELQQAMADMQASLSEVIGQIRFSADSIHTAAGEIASGNLDLSSRTRKLPCQVDSRLLESAAVVSLGRNCLGGSPPRAS